MFLAGEIFSGYPGNYALGERKKEKRPVAEEVCTLRVSVFPSLFLLLIFPSLTWTVTQETLILVLMLPLFSSVSLGHGTFQASVPHL